MNMRAASSTIASCSSSLEPKWAKSPLLLMPSSLASRWSDTYSRPSADASRAAWLRIAWRVRAPRTRRPSVSSSAAIVTRCSIARPIVLLSPNKATGRSISGSCCAMVVMQEGFAGQAGLGRLEPTDAEPLRRFFYRLSAESVYKRFLSPFSRPEQLTRLHLLEVDGLRRQALVALVGGE